MLKRNKLSHNQSLFAYGMVAPAALCILILAIIPLLTTVFYSTESYRLQDISEKKIIALGNYLNLMKDSEFWVSFKNTAVFTFSSVVCELILGLIIALFINRPFRGRGIVRASILIPWAVPTIVAAEMWRFMYNDQVGVVNDILSRLGIIHGYQSWLGSPNSALASAIFADVWKTTPFMVLLLMAGLSIIPAPLYESAKVDGGSRFKQFWYITLPMLKSTILVAVIFRTLDAFRVFDIIYVLTGGGPANSTETLSLFAYKTMFENLNFGMGSAIAIFIFIFIALISIIYLRLLNDDMLEF
jgi:multiple sugar transport system permease protein